MFRKSGHVLLIVAMLAAVGGHWAVLQSVAWTNMLADNLRQASVTEAFQKTFDGNHPCNLCKAIKEGKKSEKQAEFSIQLKKFEFVSEPVVFTFNPPREFFLLPEDSFTNPVFSHQPPVPPPRSCPG